MITNTKVKVRKAFSLPFVIDLSLVKSDIERILLNVIDAIFFGKRFEAGMECFIILAVVYFVGHIIAALIRGWPGI
jgi:hypothetical protein